MPRFAILEHDHPHLHWDLLLEAGDVLWTWRLPRIPQAGEVLEAERVFDHRLVYLDYEGPISGGRGTVIRREQGLFEWLVREETLVEVQLHGLNLHGMLRLRQNEANCWHVELGG